MAARQGKKRSESMMVRMQKMAITDGYDLWWKGYPIGALRLLQYKVESVPPFQQANCLETLAFILTDLEEHDEGEETYNLAANRFDLVQQPLNGALMRIKATQYKDDPAESFEKLDAVLKEADPEKQGTTFDDKKRKQLGKLWYFHAEMLLKQGRSEEAVAECEYSIQLGWDWVYKCYLLLGGIAVESDPAKAMEMFKLALGANSKCYEAAEAVLELSRASGDAAAIHAAIDTCLGLHPKRELIKEKAFMLSDVGEDEQAIAVLDKAIADPPREETEAMFTPGAAAAVLQHAKACILADQGRIEEAAICLETALNSNAEDEDCLNMRRELEQDLQVSYAKKHNLAVLVDRMVGHILAMRPENPAAEMAKFLEEA